MYFSKQGSDRTPPTALRLNGDKHKVSGSYRGQGLQPRQTQTGDPVLWLHQPAGAPPPPPTASCRWAEAPTPILAGLHHGDSKPCFSPLQHLLKTCRYRTPSSSCQTKAYHQIQHTHSFFSTHHQHSPEGSTGSVKSLLELARAYLRYKPSPPLLSASSNKRLQNTTQNHTIQGRRILHEASRRPSGRWTKG